MTERVDLSPTSRSELVSRLPRVPELGPLIDALVAGHDGLAALAVDRRRLAVTADSYADLIEPMSEALDTILWSYPDEQVNATREHMVNGLLKMREAAQEAELADIAPATAAEVIGVLPFFDDTGIAYWAVYLEAPMPVPYEAGQTFPVLRPEAVEVAAAEGTDVDPQWVSLAPAIPPNDFGELVFFFPHKAQEPGSSKAPRVGEYWTLGTPSGDPIQVSGVIDARGEALAGVRAAVFGIIEKRANERVELIVDAAGASEPGLRALAEVSDWLTLTRG